VATLLERHANEVTDVGAVDWCVTAICPSAKRSVTGIRAGIAGIHSRNHWEADQRVALERWARHIESLVV
jgi:hypothetical protein